MDRGDGLRLRRGSNLSCRGATGAGTQVHVLARRMSAIQTLETLLSPRIGTAVTGLTLASENASRVCTHG